MSLNRPRPSGGFRLSRVNRPSDAFPIDPLLPQIRASLAAHPRLVLEAPPGAGKTTQVPPALLEAPWLARAEDRDARTAPRRRARGRPLHGTPARRRRRRDRRLPHPLREQGVGGHARSRCVTEGILTRMIQDDPTLEGVGALLFDEFHERHLAADLGLALALDVQAATARGPAHRGDVGDAGWRAPGRVPRRAAPEQRRPQLPGDDRALPVAARRSAGAPGTARGRAGAGPTSRRRAGVPAGPARDRARRSRCWTAGEAARAVDVLPLHGELPVEQQSRVLQPDPDGHRRVVLATNVAESSVTLPGVRVVIDAGWRASRATTPTAASRGSTWSASRRPRPTSAPAAPGASPKAALTACGRSRSGWNRNGGPRSRRSNWPAWRWNWRLGATPTCASSTRRRRVRWPRRANCCNGWAR